MLYRSTKEPLKHSEIGGFLPIFQNKAPGFWYFDSRYWPEFEKIYGADEAKFTRETMLVPENIDPTAVGGTNWNDLTKRVREVFFDLEEPEQPLVPGPDEEIWINPITGKPQIRKKKEKTIGELTLSEGIVYFRAILR